MKKLFITAVLMINMLLTATVPGYATASPASWSPVGGTPWSQMAGHEDLTNVYRLIAINGTLYAGTDGGVWSWDGSAWSQVGGSNVFTGDAAAVYDLAVVSSTLYAGTWGGVVWSWNGSSWSRVGGSGARLDDAQIVNSLAAVNGTLYAGTPYGVWAWNGSSWSSVPDSVWPADFAGGAVNGPRLAAINGTLYAGTFGHGVWSWDGFTWTQVGGSGGLAGSASMVGSLVMANSALYAGTDGSGVWSWNGSSWSQVGGSNGLTGDAANVYDLASVNGTLYAGTTGGVLSWDGSSWSQVSSTGGLLDGATIIRCLAAVNGTLYAGTDDGVFSIPIINTLPSMVEFTVGSDQYISDGIAHSVSTVPFIENGRTYLGSRDMGYAIGMGDSDIVWNSGGGTASFNYDGHTAVFTLGSKSYMVDGDSRQMDVTPIDLNGRIFVPASFFAQAFGYQVSWDQATQVVSLTLQG